MNLSIGIVGLPNVGKSTLFKALTQNDVKVANYPFATIDPNVGVVSVADDRLKKLAELSRSAETIPAVVEFYDIAGLVKGASKGEGLGNQFLSHIRETHVVLQVLRCFESGDIIHVESKVDPLRDMEIINAELALRDLATIEKASKKIASEARGGDKEAQKAQKALEKAQEALERGNLLFEEAYESIRELPRVRELNLLTAKRQMYLLNGAESDVPQVLREKLEALGITYIVMNLAEKVDFTTLVRAAYQALGLMSFFTTGEKETRAWTTLRGSTAPQAAGVIHTDFEKAFIRAEVINWEVLLECGGWAGAKQKGKLRVEGKDYIVQDGDVLVVRHGA